MGIFSAHGNARHALLGCGVALLVVCLPMACVGGCLYNSWKNFPERAKKEAIETRFATHLNQIDQALAQGAPSALKLGSQLEDMTHPSDLVYMALVLSGSGSSSDVVIVDRTGGSSGKSHTIFFGAGYGNRGGTDVLIYEKDISDVDGVEHLLLCWLDPGPSPNENAASQ